MEKMADTSIFERLMRLNFFGTLYHKGNPLGKNPLHETKIMTAEECAELIVEATIKRQWLLLTGKKSKIGRFTKLFAPEFIDRIAAKAIDEKK